MAGAPLHIYFLARGGCVLFYRTTDRLSFYSVLSVLAKRFGVTVLGVSFMFTHVHLMVRTSDLAQLRLFIGQLIKTFSRLLREDRAVAGPQFETPFGSAPKVSLKEQRSCLIYIWNNPVEKKLCTKAVKDRWTFLAYYNNPFPFSERLVKRYASAQLQKACSVIDGESRAGRYLRPRFLRTLFATLVKKEQEQLADYIIGAYRFIDYTGAVKLFDSFDQLLIATEASTGKEFDVGEQYDPLSDAPYREMLRLVSKGHLFDNWKLLHLEPDEQKRLFRIFKNETAATDRQIRKFLHMDDALLL